MSSLLLIALLAVSDGGQASGEADCPSAFGLAVQLDGGGWFIPEDRAQRVSCILDAREKEIELLRARSEELEERAATSNPMLTVTISLLVGFGLASVMFGSHIFQK